MSFTEPPAAEPRRAGWFPESLRGNEEFIRLFREWEDHKRGQGYPITPTARPHVLQKLAAAGPGKACAALERSLAESASILFMDDRPSGGKSSEPVKAPAPKAKPDPARWQEWLTEQGRPYTPFYSNYTLEIFKTAFMAWVKEGK